jgi:hypothetical protein
VAIKKSRNLRFAWQAMSPPQAPPTAIPNKKDKAKHSCQNSSIDPRQRRQRAWSQFFEKSYQQNASVCSEPFHFSYNVGLSSTASGESNA